MTRLREADGRTLILVDEAHSYRNVLLSRRDRERRVIQRLERVVAQGARVVLMTGSAYGTSVQNLDSLLYLLPHRNPDALDNRGPWKVTSHQRFNELPTVAVLGYPHVLEMARQRGDVEDGRPFVDLDTGERQYLPMTLRTQIVTYDLPLEDEVAAAFAARCFDQGKKIPTLGFSDEEGEIERTTDTIFNATLGGWLSSPRELDRCIAENLRTEGYLGQPLLLGEESADALPEGQLTLWGQVVPEQRWKEGRDPDHANGYQAKLRLDTAARRPRLDLLRRRLAPLVNQPDDKASKLLDVLLERRASGPLKVIVFVERRVTALYLEQVLRDREQALRVACTVAPSGKLKRAEVRADLLRRFSPGSHGLPPQDRPENDDSFEVLICTDADGIGVNLQDADTVINYDLTAGADRLVQRLGRILRSTPTRDRIPHVYTFRPACVERSEPNSNVHRHIRQRFGRLFDRHEKSSRILGSRILAEDGQRTTVSLDGKVDVAAFLKLLSARLEPESQRVESEVASAALDLLACPPHEPRAGVLSIKVPQILDAADEAVRQWCNRRGESLEDVERAATLYLLPRP